MSTTSSTEIQQLKEFIGDRFNQLDQKVDEVRKDLKDLSNKVESIDKRLVIVETKVDSIENRFGKLLCIYFDQSPALLQEVWASKIPI